MNARGENVDDRAVGGDGPVRRTRITLAVAAGAALVVGLLALAVAPATAVTSAAVTSSAAAAGADPDPGTTPTPTPAPQDHLTPAPPTTSPSRPPVRPSIDDPGDITSGTVRFSGGGTPGHALRVTGPASTGCTATVHDDGAWSCLATVRSGPQQVFTVADQSFPGLGSARTPASDVIVPPVVTTARPTNGPVTGTGHAGSTVTLSVSGSSVDRTATVGADGRWTVSLRGGTPGGDARLSVTATQTASTADGYRSDLRSAASTPVTVTLDRTAPTAPRITAPGSGDRVRVQPLTVSGTGEAGAVLTVYVDRAPVCRTEVPASGRWSCTTAGSTLGAGTRAVTATQHDAAGNFSPTSTAVRIVVSRASAAPGAPGDGSTGSGSPSGTPAGTGSTGTATGPTGHGTATGGSSGPGTGPGSGSGSDGGVGGSTGAGSGSGSGSTTGGHGRGLDWSGPAGDWTASTAYDTTVPTIQAAFSWRTVLVATAVAAGFLVLIAGPLALVAGVARGRIRSPFAGLLGRNRPRDERRRGEDVLPTWASITVAVLVVGLCTLLGVGISLEARYVRLAIAVLLGAAVLTTTIVLATRWAAGTDRSTIGFRVSPWLVLAALVACGVTRTFELSPAVIVGAVLVPIGRPDLDTRALRLGSSIAAGTRSATWRSIALLVVAAAGWVLHSVTPGSGFWVSFVSEFAITLCVGGLGAVVVTLLPVAGSAGQSLLARSRGRYAAIAAVAVALAAAVYSGSAGTHVSPVALVVVAAVCAAGAVAVWCWQRVARVDQRA
ncbi:Ig-like domain-containing protein [Curtobacterium sp. SORGH_AS_0776]|uniref:Ig-like domain-containing protein n=1 Tax=Curtobacterium sp. SORGH_AS_0776 TaxID=3041798 RepID=UPI00285DC5CD|nr:Ig-like domain-containing protein [Curtobacterium sp. SORGH_AS_0776]MDR6170681.1 hypothetical protein [Curtobacterium sp. SORGH_AS_0776]